MRSSRKTLLQNSATLEWVGSSAAFYGITGYVLLTLRFIALGTTFRLWRGFLMSIAGMAKALGCCRSTVEKALKKLRDLKLIAYDGQEPSGKGRPFAKYRLTGTPECPLPEWVVDAREEDRERLAGTAPEWEPKEAENAPTSAFTYRTNPTSGKATEENYSSVQPSGFSSDSSGTEELDSLPSEKSEAQPVYPSSKTTKTEPKDEPDPSVALGGDLTSALPRRRWEPRRRRQTRALLAKKRAEEVLARFGSYWNLALPDRLREMLLPEVESPSPGTEDRGNVIPPRSFTAGGAVMNPFTDPALGSLPRDVRLLFLGLERLFHADPHVSTDPRFLKGEIFRYDDDITPDIIADMLSLIEEAEVSFSAPQPPQGALFGIPTAPAAPQAPQTPHSTKEALFQQLWLTWPKGRRIDKGGSLKAFIAACNKAHPQHILAAAIAQTNNWIEIDKQIQYIPHLKTWLNGGRWDDELEAAPEVRSRVQDAARQNAALIEFYRRQEAEQAAIAPTGQKAISW